MQVASCDRDDIAHAGRWRGLAISVVTPRGHRAVGPQREGVLTPRSDRFYCSQPARHRNLAERIVAPALNKPHVEERKAERVTSGNRHHRITRAERDIALAGIVAPPS